MAGPGFSGGSGVTGGLGFGSLFFGSWDPLASLSPPISVTLIRKGPLSPAVNVVA